jgi:hypothetical protein
MDDELIQKFESALVLPSRKSEKDKLLNEKEIRELFEKWKLNKTSHALRILKETIIVRKMSKTILALDIYDSALDYYSDNELWAEFLATASHNSKFKMERDILSVAIDPLNINDITNSTDNNLFLILSDNYCKLNRSTDDLDRLKLLLRKNLQVRKSELVNIGIIR